MRRTKKPKIKTTWQKMGGVEKQAIDTLMAFGWQIYCNVDLKAAWKGKTNPSIDVWKSDNTGFTWTASYTPGISGIKNSKKKSGKK